MKKSTWKILLSVVVVAGGISLLWTSSSANAEYYKHVNEVMVHPDEWDGKSFKMHGFVEAGSIKEQIVDQKTHRSFVLTTEAARVRVVHIGPKPDTFKELAEVVASGKLIKEGDEFVFHASDLTAKCPSKYEENKRSKPLPTSAAR